MSEGSVVPEKRFSGLFYTHIAEWGIGTGISLDRECVVWLTLGPITLHVGWGCF